MAAEAWTIDVDGVMRELTIEVDPATGRAAFRVDGKMAAKPLAPGEEERIFSIGATQVIVRREGNSFAVETALDETAFAAQQSVRTALPDASGIPTGKLVGMGVAVVAALLVFGWVRPIVKRWSATWKPYTAPDATFRIQFPFEPTTSTKTITAAGRSIDLNIVEGMLTNHELGIAYFDMENELPYAQEYRAYPMFEAAEKAIAGEHGGVVVKRWESNVNGHVGEEFIAEAGKQRVRGKIAVNRKRIFLAMAVVPQGDAMAYDVGQFLRSLELPDYQLSGPPQ